MKTSLPTVPRGIGERKKKAVNGFLKRQSSMTGHIKANKEFLEGKQETNSNETTSKGSAGGLLPESRKIRIVNRRK